jgi:uncharacterized protein YqjF (DUF2071 family)
LKKHNQMSQPTATTRLAIRERPTARNPIMYQKWRNLLFLHWQYDAQVIQSTLPPGLQVDTFAGKAYVGVTPFFLIGAHPRFLPPVPGLSDFLEVNVRTYVYDRHGIPGIWFYSLDASQWVAVQGARFAFHLPYFHATMQASINPASREIAYFTHRKGTDPQSRTHFRYRSLSEFGPAAPETLAFFLIERYVLFAYSQRQKQLFRGRVYHLPYPLLDVEVAQSDSNLLCLDGLAQPNRPPDHLLMSPGVDVEIFGLDVVE